MMCICGNALPANAEACPACGGSFAPGSSPIPIARPKPKPIAVSEGAQEAKPRFDPAITVAVIIFVLTVVVGVVLQSIA